jgi:hypothetical protein
MKITTQSLFFAAAFVCYTTVGVAGNNRISLSSAETITPLVELYTSEGCSSCPSADKFLSRLGGLLNEEFHAVPLAFHVDYWNWLGWTDPFSKQQYTDRQRVVAKLNKQRSIYTPELIVTGKESRGGGTIYDWITRRNGQHASVQIMIDVIAPSANNLQADIDIKANPSLKHAQVFVAIYENGIVREITGGENEGETLTHDFVVRHWSEPVEVNQGRLMKQVTFDIKPDWNPENIGIAIIVVDEKTGETLQALNSPLNALYGEIDS